MIIQLIGLRRLINVFILLAVNGLFIAAFFVFAEPLKSEATKRLKSTNGEITSLRSKIRNIKEELKLLEEKKGTYEALQNSGFFTKQDYFLVTRSQAILEEKTFFKDLKMSASGVSIIESKDAKKAGFNLEKRQLTIANLHAPFDVYYYTLIDQFDDVFPGHIRIGKVNIKRIQDSKKSFKEQVNNMSSKDSSLLDASIELDWYTLVPIPEEKKTKAPGYGR